MDEFLLQMRISYLGEMIKLLESDYLARETKELVIERINLLSKSIEQDLELRKDEENSPEIVTQ